MASHISSAILTYAHVSGNTYKVTLQLYGNCGTASHACFTTLSTAVPQICLFNGSTYETSFNLTIDSPKAGIFATQICPGDVTQCTDPASTIPGQVLFVYSGNITLPDTSSCWQFVFDGSLGASCAAGRAAAITNIAGGSSIQLVDTLNNTIGYNSSPIFANAIATSYLINTDNSYYPEAMDPDHDSLVFSLDTLYDGASTCVIGGTVTYPAPYSPTYPLACAIGSFTFSSTTGDMLFYPNAVQRSVASYNVQEYRGGVKVGTSTHEVLFTVTTTDSPAIYVGYCTGTPTPGTVTATTNCGGYLTLNINTYSCGAALQWQYSSSGTGWSNLINDTSATATLYPYNTGYYRCMVTCDSSGTSVPSSEEFVVGASGTAGMTVVVAVDSDSVCAPVTFITGVCPCTDSCKVITYFGDGTTATNTFTVNPSADWIADVQHTYSITGVFPMKQVLYDSSVAIDSSFFNFNYSLCTSLPTGLQTPTDREAIQLYPNPASTVLNVAVSADAYATATLLNAIGTVLQSQALSANHAAFKIASLPPGIYFIQLIGKEGIATQKFIKM